MRGWLARGKVDEVRMRVCKAVEIQAIWRGYLVRKQLVRLKQAIITLQAYWRGKIERERQADLFNLHLYMCLYTVHVYMQINGKLKCNYPTLPALGFDRYRYIPYEFH